MSRLIGITPLESYVRDYLKSTAKGKTANANLLLKAAEYINQKIATNCCNPENPIVDLHSGKDNTFVHTVWTILTGMSRKNHIQSLTRAYNNILNFVNSPCCIDPDAVAFITAAGLTDPTQIAAIFALVASLKGQGLWNLIDAIYPLIGGTASSSKFNLKDPRDLDAAYRLTFTGGVTFNANGITFDGGTGYADTHFIPASNLTLNNQSLGGYIRVASTAGVEFGAAAYTYFWPTNLGAALNDNGNALTLPVYKGMVTLDRSTSSTYGLYINGFLGTTITAPSLTNVAYSIYLGALNNSGPASIFSNPNYAFFYIGQSLGGAAQLALNNIIYTYQVALGRAIPPLLYPSAYFFGDSITVGVGASPSTDRWTTLLCLNKGLSEFNLGIGGTTLLSATPVVVGNMYDRASTDIPTKGLNDKYLFISYGVNDAGYNYPTYTPSLFATQLQTILTICFSRGWSPINIIVNTGYYVNNPWSLYVPPSPIPGDLTRYNSFISAAQSVAIANGTQFIDPYAYMAANGGNSLLNLDGLHPNNSGCAAIATYIESVIV